MEHERKEVRLAAGPIRYRETGAGRPVVFVHGFLVDGRLWDGVATALGDRFCCVVPDWPFGSHRVAMDPGADLSPPANAATIAEFLDELDLEDVTIVGNDSGGAISQILAANHPRRIGRLVLTNCDTHENFPPGIFKAMTALAKLPGATEALALPLRAGAVARFAYRGFAAKPIAPELVASWVEPSRRDPAVRRDTRKVAAGFDKRHTLAAAARLRESPLPLLLAWAPGDRYFPISYAERLAGEAGNARLIRIEGAKTFVPLDQPEAVAAAIAEFGPAS